MCSNSSQQPVELGFGMNKNSGNGKTKRQEDLNLH